MANRNVVLVLVTAAVALAAAPAPSGFRGHVTIGPLTPVCRTATPCGGPAKGVTLFFTRYGLTKRAVTSVGGDYRILLHSGIYVVRASRGMSIRPMRVHVHAGLVAKLNFAVDTGIR